MQADISAEFLDTKLSRQILLPRRHPCCAITLKLLRSLLIARLETASLNITKLLAEVTFALKTRQKLPATTVSALTSRSKVLNYLPLLRISDSFALLDVHYILHVGSHVLVDLLLPELSGSLRLERRQVGVVARLRSLHILSLSGLRSRIADVSKAAKSTYIKLSR